jgi:adenylate cyclase
LLLAAHFAGTRYVISALGGHVDYSVVLYGLWFSDPIGGVAQALLVVIAWSHGCIGIAYNLRLRRWYERGKPLLLAIAMLVPVLALLGYFEASRGVIAAAQNPEWVRLVLGSVGVPAEALAASKKVATIARVGVVLCLATILFAPMARLAVWRRARAVTLVYPANVQVRIRRGMSVLEASREAGVPHASICGGRGRCSTCRIRVSGDPSSIPEPAEDEMVVLRRIGLPPNVRLACRLRPLGDIAVTPLLASNVSMASIRQNARAGVEREVAILFCDIRAFTKLAESKLPYDVVYILNRYFAEMGGAVEGANGRVDKFIGDGVMGLFGIEDPIDAACRQALAAAAAMSQRIRHLNQELAPDLPMPLRLAIGVHAGPVIVGEMGWGRVVGLTAIGDAVNIASRLEALSKELQVELAISAEVAKHATIDPSSWARHETHVRGRNELVVVYALTSAADVDRLP